MTGHETPDDGEDDGQDPADEQSPIGIPFEQSELSKYLKKLAAEDKAKKILDGK